MDIAGLTVNPEESCCAIVVVRRHDGASVGSVLLPYDDEWAVQRAIFITLESIAPISDDPLVGLPYLAADRSGS